MKNYSLILSKKAENQIEMAYSYYDLVSTKVSDDFLFNFEDSLNSIIKNPFLYQIQEKYFRQAPMAKFPYVIIYSIENESVILINCFFHTSQNPKKKFK